MSRQALVMESKDSQFCLMEGMLQRLGFEVKRVVTIEKTMEEISQRIPDVVVSAIIMSSNNNDAGFKLNTMLRESPATKFIPLIFNTTRYDLEVLMKIWRMNVSGEPVFWLKKPSNIEKLTLALHFLSVLPRPNPS